MRTQAHWEVCKLQKSYHAAHLFAMQLAEVARANNVSTEGIEVFSKKRTRTHGSIADAQVHWNEGPAGWVQGIGLCDLPGVCIEIEDECTVAFYDI